MTTTKRIVLFLHRWLGFSAGLAVFIVSITGCIFCFQDEIQDMIYSYRKVAPLNQPFISPSQLINKVHETYPKDTINYLSYSGKDRPAEVFVNTKNGMQAIYLNPYSGIITHAEDPQRNFFTVVKYIHLYLLLPPKTGAIVVGGSVIIFLVILITGIILWWPKRKSDRKRSFTIKWGSRWRRVNYDLHNVLGFYASVVTVILAITGLAIAFESFNKAIYYTANLGKNYPLENSVPKPITEGVNTDQPAVDIAFNVSQQFSPLAEMFLLYIPSGKTGAIQVTAYAKSLHYGNNDNYYFDRKSGKLLGKLIDSQKSTGRWLNDLNYDIHVGQVWGITGKIIAFLASLICGSLPVTGLIIWLGKKKKSRLLI